MLWMSNANGAVTFANKPYSNFTGPTSMREVDKFWTEHMHAEDLPHFLQSFRPVCQARNSLQREYRLTRADGGHQSMCVMRHNLYRSYGSRIVEIMKRVADAALAARFRARPEAVHDEASFCFALRLPAPQPSRLYGRHSRDWMRAAISTPSS